jgi:outer membrane protein assembly factor BamB
VVNHRGREAVELFELVDGDDPARTRLVWRGCVPAPAEVWMNDVVGLPGGGFAVTHMVPRNVDGEVLFEAERVRNDIGHVLTWMPETGWQKVPGSDGALPNGIEVSDDGTILYVNEYFGDRVYALERASGKRLWSTAVDAPDNSSWGMDGRLLVASHHADLEAVLACDHEPLTMCPLAFSIVAIDPANGRRVTIVEGGGEGAPMGAATVAVEHAGRLWLGSYVGDRLAATKRGTGVRP